MSTSKTILPVFHKVTQLFMIFTIRDKCAAKYSTFVVLLFFSKIAGNWIENLIYYIIHNDVGSVYQTQSKRIKLHFNQQKKTFFFGKTQLCVDKLSYFFHMFSHINFIVPIW